MEQNSTPEVTAPAPQNPTPPQIKKDNHWVTIAAMALFVLASLSLTAFLYYQNQQLKSMLADYQNTPSPTPTIQTPSPTPESAPTATTSATPKSTSKACTQEAKLCPDGSYVGREGPNCEFAPCPTP